MNAEAIVRITEEALPKIRAIAQDGKIQSATGSLAAWGAINLGAWFLLGGDSREFLSNLHNPSEGIYFLLYGGLVIGALMLFFAALGATTRFSGTMLLDGVSLITVGLWNVTNDFIAMVALEPYGYTIEKPSIIWIILGICQIVWGMREVSTFGRVVSWNIPKFARNDLADFKKQLQSFVQIGESPQEGIVKCSVTTKGPLGLDFMSQTTEYTGKLIDDTVIMVSVKLNDCFTIQRQEVSEATFGSNGSLKVRVEQAQKSISLSPLSVIAFKTWCAIPIQAEDIHFAATKKALTLQTLQPSLASDDPNLRVAAVSALSSISDSSVNNIARKYVDDQNPVVQAAALQLCAAHKIPDVQSESISLLNHSDERVRIAAAQYLSDFPDPSVLAPLEKAFASEARKDVKKHIKRALRSVKKQS